MNEIYLNNFDGYIRQGEPSQVAKNQDATTSTMNKGGQKNILTTQKTTQKILAILQENPKLTRQELAQMIGITQDGVKWNLDKLKKENKIKRIGPDKGGHWEIITKEDNA